MFDSKELAKKALQRVEQIKKARKRKRQGVAMICAALCICAVGILFLTTPEEHDIMLSDTDQPTRYIVEPAVPLARPPTVTTAICATCGIEIEEQPDYNEDEEQQCEECKRE